MNFVNYWISTHPWVVSAACDTVAGFALAGMAVLVARRPRYIRGQVLAAPAPAAEPEALRSETHALPRRMVTVAAQQAVAEAATVMAGPTVRRDAVERAIAALDRWESTYRAPARGLDELSRLAQKRRQDMPPAGKQRSS